MKRRDFIKLSSTASAGFLLPLDVMGMLKKFNIESCPNNSNKKLVLIQLQGANDGLNTLIPINQYDLYSTLRPTIKISNSGANGFIPLDNTLYIENQIGLHPSLTGFKNLYDSGLMRIIQGVGYPKQDKSHFKSTDLWFTGGDGTQLNNTFGTGWMARFLENNYSQLINSNFPLGIQLGSSDNSLGFHSVEHQTLSMNLNNQDLNGYYSIVNGLSGDAPSTIPNSEYGDLLRFILENDKKTNTYANKITSSFNTGINTTTYPNTSIANQLKTVAKLISGGLETKIYLVKIGSFDTHDNQVVEGSTHTGSHAKLLGEVSDAVKVFFADMASQNKQNEIMGITFSEFGRKIAENGSLGTDHGEVAPMFVFGGAVNPGISGTNINLTEATLANNYQVKTVQYDYRQVFSTVIQDWLGVNNTILDATFFDKMENKKFSTLKIPNLINEQNLVTKNCYNNTLVTPDNDFIVYPNPAANVIYVNAKEQKINSIELFDITGKLLKQWKFNMYQSKITLDLDYYTDGIYILNIISENKIESKKIIIKK
ncbi:MAG: DUF1501 domain-containing protein [Solirubrobacteraceae bacterium]